MCSVFTVVGDVGLGVVLDLLVSKVAFGRAHLEEVSTGRGSGIVVFIPVGLRIFSNWSFNIPEYVIGERVEDLFSSRGRDSSIETLAQILSEGVLVSVENIELFSHHFVKVFGGDASFFHLSKQRDAHLVFLFFSDLTNFVALVVESVKLGTHSFFSDTTEITLLDLEDKSTISVFAGVSKGIEHLLSKRSSLVTTTVLSGRSDGLNGLLIVLFEALLVLVESEVFSSVVSVIFLLARLMVGNVDILESTSLLFS